MIFRVEIFSIFINLLLCILFYLYYYKWNWIFTLFKNFVSEQCCYWLVYVNFVNFPTLLNSQYRSNRFFRFVCFLNLTVFQCSSTWIQPIGRFFLPHESECLFLSPDFRSFQSFLLYIYFLSLSSFLLFLMFSYCKCFVSLCPIIPIAVFNLFIIFSFSLLSQ